MIAALRTEIVVIGGGPAGTIVANALVNLGRRVVLCEASCFPREHVGISLSEGVRTQLAFVGLEDLLHQPAHKQGLPIEQRWEGVTFEPVVGATSMVVDRGVFDADLLRAARRLGVQILQPATVRASEKIGDSWQLQVSTPISDILVEANFVIDASGRRTRFRRRQRQGKSTLALWGRWRGRSAESVRVSAQHSSWCWGAPLSAGQSALVCFADPHEFRRRPGSLLDRYLTLAHESEVLGHIDELALVGVPQTCDATAYSTEGETAGLLRVGDADVALDPLSSSGVQAAIQSALAAGPIVNTLLTPGQDGLAALEFWRRRRSFRAAQHQRWAGQFYRKAFAVHSSAFWSDRFEVLPDEGKHYPTASLPHPDQPIALSGQTSLVLAPCLVGSLVKLLECVDHANLPEPIAFVAGVHLTPLLRCVARPAPAREVLTVWSASVASDHLAYSLLAWAWRFDILTAAQ